MYSRFYQLLPFHVDCLTRKEKRVCVFLLRTDLQRVFSVAEGCTCVSFPLHPPLLSTKKQNKTKQHVLIVLLHGFARVSLSESESHLAFFSAASQTPTFFYSHFFVLCHYGKSKTFRLSSSV